MKINHILRNKGFTLIELLVAMAISGIIMTGIYSAFTTQQDSYFAQDQVAEMQQNIRAGLYIMTSDIRMVGYDPLNTDKFGVESATGSKFVFTMDLNNNGLLIPIYSNPGERLTYELYTPGTDGSALRRIAGQSAVAENIEELEFYYTLEDDTQTTTPTTAQLDSIRSVEISILAIAGHSDRNFTNSHTYTSASGVDWTPASPDNFRRRFQTMTVKCRNMGL
ncbi:MAG: prepilin-type N-terminal cleavage/methylation domain-containing protein [Methylococcales bacterium]